MKITKAVGNLFSNGAKGLTGLFKGRTVEDKTADKAEAKFTKWAKKQSNTDRTRLDQLTGKGARESASKSLHNLFKKEQGTSHINTLSKKELNHELNEIMRHLRVSHIYESHSPEKDNSKDLQKQLNHFIKIIKQIPEGERNESEKLMLAEALARKNHLGDKLLKNDKELVKDTLQNNYKIALTKRKKNAAFRMLALASLAGVDITKEKTSIEKAKDYYNSIVTAKNSKNFDDLRIKLLKLTQLLNKIDTSTEQNQNVKTSYMERLETLFNNSQSDIPQDIKKMLASAQDIHQQTTIGISESNTHTAPTNTPTSSSEASTSASRTIQSKSTGTLSGEGGDNKEKEALSKLSTTPPELINNLKNNKTITEGKGESKIYKTPIQQFTEYYQEINKAEYQKRLDAIDALSQINDKANKLNKKGIKPSTKRVPIITNEYYDILVRSIDHPQKEFSERAFIGLLEQLYHLNQNDQFYFYEQAKSICKNNTILGEIFAKKEESITSLVTLCNNTKNNINEDIKELKQIILSDITPKDRRPNHAAMEKLTEAALDINLPDSIRLNCFKALIDTAEAYYPSLVTSIPERTILSLDEVSKRGVYITLIDQIELVDKALTAENASDLSQDSAGPNDYRLICSSTLTEAEALHKKAEALKML